MALREDNQGAARAEAAPRTEDDARKMSVRTDDERKPGGLRARLATLRRHPYITAAVVIAVVIALLAVLIWWLNARHYESTDDAYIDTRTVQVSAQVGGQIVAVPVTDNESVAAGTTLVRIDPRDYRAALEQAEASVANFEAQISAQQANIDQAQKQVTQAEAALQYAQQQNARAQELLTRGAGTEQQSQQTASDLKQKTAALAGAQSNVISAQKQLAVLRAQRKSAQASLDKAVTDLARTTISAPEEGRVAKLTAATGNYAQPGQALMALVPARVWVTANFKETQLTDMKVGQPVDITVDAFPDRTFRGHVDSIQAGSGAAFSLLPPENATGNFVKVVQRVPVKIVFDDPPGVYLGPGMSVVPSVRVR